MENQDKFNEIAYKKAQKRVEDYAKRKGMDLETAEKWLAPVLNYE